MRNCKIWLREGIWQERKSVIKLDQKVMFEISPPSKRANKERIATVAEKISATVNRMECINGINIPEVLDESRSGKPWFKNMDAREYGKILHEKTRREIIVNKVVVFSQSEEAFREWLNSTVKEFGIRKIVLVGGSRDSQAYPGPSVLDANKIVKEFGGVEIGNISIPSRKNEAKRALEKTLAGCSFFTTQVLMDSVAIKSLLVEYAELCKRNELKPAAFFLSYAPVGDTHDIEFLKWLDVEVPPKIEASLLSSPKMDQRSIELARKGLKEVLGFIKERKLDVPVSLNVEQISLHNLEPAVEMVNELWEEFKRN